MLTRIRNRYNNRQYPAWVMWAAWIALQAVLVSEGLAIAYVAWLLGIGK